MLHGVEACAGLRCTVSWATGEVDQHHLTVNTSPGRGIRRRRGEEANGVSVIQDALL